MAPPADIKALRTRELASQTVFARVLNVTPGLVSQWERGGANGDQRSKTPKRRSA